jgi:hypothetical protein
VAKHPVLFGQERSTFRSAISQEAAPQAAGQHAFRAAPVPPTLRHPAQLPPVPEKLPTAPMPFKLASEARHHEVIAHHMIATPTVWGCALAL